MMNITGSCEAKEVLGFFSQISNIPRGSGNMAQISEYICNFAKENNLDYYRDEYFNVYVYKPASKGYENCESLILQGHLDMVCVAEDKERDFLNKGISLVYENDFLRADGTSLGADNGIGVAMILCVLASKTASHPKIEAVFTVDEEVGMLGAAKLDFSRLNSKKMINLDCDGEGVFTVSCAGGATVKCHIPVKPEKFQSESYTGLKIDITGLTGGHSGVRACDGLANANIVCIRLLKYLSDNNIDYCLSYLNGGEKENAIPSFSSAEIYINKDHKQAVKSLICDFEKMILQEYKDTEKNIVFNVTETVLSEHLAGIKASKRLVSVLSEYPSGVISMSKDIEGLAESSLNLGIMSMTENGLQLCFGVRSSDKNKLEEITQRLKSITTEINGNIFVEGMYPAWEFKKDSAVRENAVYCYKKLFGDTPKIMAIHAGLECGIFAENIKDFDCIAIGPNNFYEHSPMERVSISSVGRTYVFLLEMLKNLK